jgi:formate dehydrogenase iron-sulfur subunit
MLVGRALAMPASVANLVTLSQFLERAESAGSAHEPVVANTRPVMDRLKALDRREREAVSDQMSLPTLLPGEQYRFHFDMTRCIGCRCCEVACNEQNGNPAEVTWRRVGEIEGGSYPHVKRFHLSMACNHCLDPACLEGCPTEAYEKLANGIVKHHADLCIGCQYCTWNCPYGVPQYNPERRIVTKCHMCVDRIGGGNLPACVEACPVQAIQIEKIRPEEWRAAIDSANAPGVPPADLTLSTTRLTLPENLPEAFGEHTAHKLTPEPAHWSLVFFLTVSQGSVGLFAFALVAWLWGASRTAGFASLGAILLGHAALTGTLFHLGRPARALRAIAAVRRSWLSREVVAFSAFAGLGAVPPALFFLDSFGLASWTRFQSLSLSVTSLVGLVAVYTSVRIYRIPARPAWDSPRTNLQFFLTVLVLGAAAGLFVQSWLGASLPLMQAAALTLSASISLSALMPFMLALDGMRGEPSVHAAARILSQSFSRVLVARTLLALAVALASGVVAWSVREALEPLHTTILLLGAFVVEGLGRYLFFRCVVPRNMPLGFFAVKPVH